MQLEPTLAKRIFAKPQNSDYHEYFKNFSLWHQFSSICLKKNHRQGNHKVYADLLNRMRVDEMTEEDFDLLESRVRPYNHPDIPQDALFVMCTNKETDRINQEKLAKNKNEEVVMKAIHIHDTKKTFQPPLKYGKVQNTPLVDNLTLKVGSKVMLTYNIDVCDSLANGCKGTVLDFIKYPNGKIRYVVVEFDNPDCGKERRKLFPQLQQKYGGKLACPIEKIEFPYSLSKRKDAPSFPAKVVQFPLCLGKFNFYFIYLFN